MCKTCDDYRVQVKKNAQLLKSHGQQLLAVTEQTNINAKIAIEVKNDVAAVKEDIKPILDGVHAIQEAVKVLVWINKLVKWIASVVVGTAGTVYVWVEYLHHFFDGKGH